jgi:molecular chaperone GrpE
MADETMPDDERLDDPLGAAGPPPEGAEEAAEGETAGTLTEAEQAIEHDLDQLLAERDQFRDIAQRLQADFENYRRRTQAQQGDEIDRATGRLVDDLLPVLDACELAFSHGVDGVEPIWSALIGVLQRHGLEAMDLQGKPFDPADAEAVMHEPGDGEPVVVEVMRTGYRWKGKVLRAAMVRVKG